MRRKFVLVVAFCSGFLGTAEDAASLSFEEFDGLPNWQRENFISTVLHYYYYNYLEDPAMAPTADCMTDLDRETAADGDPYLLSVILRDLGSSAFDGSADNSVEGVIKDIIDRECESR
ncbi:hypothetical protein H0I76_11095 [Limibaculum sp. M0105]|uniref:Uncharacterized protein n=1 Tax=Thermohalobaculum xanthum TaxID=2753746 RepID=A0A8J7SCZ2_9RHOB|nr:hypothetical protein [Thermohalobaculum xanthum]MBK0399737.1 hypothetical protein [Thermohalobaculum xanthum]